MSVDILTSKEEHVAVVSDGAVCQVGGVKMGTLSLRLHWTEYIRQSKQGQELLEREREREKSYL